METLPTNGIEQAGVVASIRRAILIILFFALSGTLVELVLLEHTDGFWQQVPLYLLGASLVVLAWHVVHRGSLSIRVLQGTMLLFALSGAAGVVLHFKGNVEFELEMHPGASGLGLLWEALKGATPTLAAGTMMPLGLLGLVYAYRHPALFATTNVSSTTEQ
ncbi:MAG: hypothetical protein ACRENI_01395 [Gemmatimonadaceae bacterium]